MVNFKNAFKGKMASNNMSYKKGFKHLNLDVKEELWERLSLFAIKKRRKKKEVIVEALEDYLKKNE